MRMIFDFPGCCNLNKFRDSIEDYLDFCEERKEKPDKPFSGKFVVRISPAIHHQILLKAVQSGKSLNRWITEILTNT